MTESTLPHHLFINFHFYVTGKPIEIGIQASLFALISYNFLASRLIQHTVAIR